MHIASARFRSPSAPWCRTSRTGSLALRGAELTEPRLVADPAHHVHSSLREKIVEHVFVGEALRTLWRRGIFDAEVLRSEFDAHGYDLVMGRGKIVRHIQFKTGVRDKPGRVSVPTALLTKPSGCVIWIQVDDSLALRRFWWFGGNPGEPLPPLGERVAKRIGRTAEGVRPMREGHRLLTSSAFRLIEKLDGVLEALFGPLPVGTPLILQDEDDADTA